MADVRIETLEHQGRRLWRVQVGRRALTFHEELAARTFAAQLHQRLRWLSQLAAGDGQDGGSR
ncbi:hypothetical protein F3I16_20545 [Pseudomonas sp. L-22-4S-12]|uniref:hypothetical protein n=1 Tax=Pseudomonas sp. L-22-4S-12 TaxID=2610893 RepID=UPI00132B7E9A|nr:hypothetical protein [Pseudomonas sp. L-22-4S-12]MWV18434.1 hypothetical protein [Pseudomonas sp. L-22-4S-12]